MTKEKQKEQGTGLAIIASTNQLDYSNAKVLAVIKATIAPDATPDEFAYFIAYCQSTNLNPLKREAWFIKTKPYTKKNGEVVEGKVQIMTGINGFIGVANSYPEYDGMEVETLEDDKGDPVKSIAKAWRKDRRLPSVGKAKWSEDAGDVVSFHGKPTVWGTRKTTMLEKVAKARALREAFPQKLSNVYLPEEFDAEERRIAPKESAQKAKGLDKLLGSPEQRPHVDTTTADEPSPADDFDDAAADAELAAESVEA